MSLRWAGVARVLTQGFSTRSWPRAAGAHYPDPRVPPAQDRWGRTWRGSTAAGGRPRRNIADARPIAVAAAPFPGTSLPPIKDNSFRGCDGASNRDGATRALVPVAVALLSLGCKDERENEGWCMPGKGGQKPSGKLVRPRKKSAAPKHDLKSACEDAHSKGG